jgi:hypothetical protein
LPTIRNARIVAASTGTDLNSVREAVKGNNSSTFLGAADLAEAGISDPFVRMVFRRIDNPPYGIDFPSESVRIRPRTNSTGAF